VRKRHERFLVGSPTRHLSFPRFQHCSPSQPSVSGLSRCWVDDGRVVPSGQCATPSRLWSTSTCRFHLPGTAVVHARAVQFLQSLLVDCHFLVRQVFSAGRTYVQCPPLLIRYFVHVCGTHDSPRNRNSPTMILCFGCPCQDHLVAAESASGRHACWSGSSCVDLGNWSAKPVSNGTIRRASDYVVPRCAHLTDRYSKENLR